MRKQTPFQGRSRVRRGKVEEQKKNYWQRNGKREAVQRKAGGVKKGGQIVFQTILIKTINNSNLICPVVTRCGLSPQLWMLLYMLVSVVVHC